MICGYRQYAVSYLETRAAGSVQLFYCQWDLILQLLLLLAGLLC